MVPDQQKITELLPKYAPNQSELERITVHGQIVAEIALDCANKLDEEVDFNILEISCLLHDIGSYVFLAAIEASTEYSNSYSQHAIFGASILREEGVDERICSAVETHVLLGLTASEIRDTGKRLPYRNYEPKTIEARLVCWGDRFHSKKPVFNRFETFYDKLSFNMPLQAKKMKLWAKEFGIPDDEALSKKYGHPIK